MSLIEINPDFTRLLVELRRIADALEGILLHGYGVRTTPVDKSELRGEPPDVTYSDDESTARRELDEARKRVEVDDSPDAEIVP
jgi:hypothetical protein